MATVQKELALTSFHFDVMQRPMHTRLYSTIQVLIEDGDALRLPRGGDMDDLADVAMAKPSRLQLSCYLKVLRRRCCTFCDVVFNIFGPRREHLDADFVAAVDFVADRLGTVRVAITARAQ